MKSITARHNYKRIRRITACVMIAVMTLSYAGCGRNKDGVITITNVSYDPTREFYEAYNEIFTSYYKDTYGEDVKVIQSHGGSGSQARSVVEGCNADVVTLALEHDISLIEKNGLVDKGWIDEFAEDSAPYTSTIVFLVRKGNPKNIKDWDDLLNDGVKVITPNPKTSGGARWNFLAAWYYFKKQGQTEEQVQASVTKLYKNVAVLDSGARGSSTTFAENGQGDVLIAWENEAFFALQEYPGEYEIVVPSASVLCQPTVAKVDEVTQMNGTEELADAYLSFLYTDDAQRLEAQNFYRPVNKDIQKEYESSSDSRNIKEIPSDGKWIVKDIDMVDIGYFGGWEAATQKFFSDGGIFDKIYD